MRSMQLWLSMKGFSSIMGLEEDVSIGNSLILFYAECGHLDYAQKVFDEMLERNTVSWTSLICGYGRRNMPKEAVSLFFKIVATGIKSNSVTMVCVISACAKLKDVALSERWSSGVVDQEFAADVAIAKWHFIPHLQNRTLSEQPNEVKTLSFMSDFLEKCGGCALLDGGFATELERHGADLNDPLRSAKCLVSSPHLVRRVHLDYLDAGANIIITASYQATIQGFEAKGFSKEEAKALLRKSVEIAIEAREIYYDKCTKGSWDFVDAGKPSRHPVLVAASVGSYGAYLADGSEYSGNYGDAVTLETLKNFHRERVQILANSGADLIAFETTPNKLEAKAYAELLEEEAIDIPAWFTFASKDGINVVSGASIFECASIANACKQVVAVGINCTPPRFIQGLISSIRKVTSKPIVIYPNSGDTYDGQSKQWVPLSGQVDEEFAEIVIAKWREAGASLFGGCCRTTPNTIRAISKALSNKSSAVNDA